MNTLFEADGVEPVSDLRSASRDVLAHVVAVALDQAKSGRYPPPHVLKAISDLAAELDPAPDETRNRLTPDQLRQLAEDLREPSPH